MEGETLRVMGRIYCWGNYYEVQEISRESWYIYIYIAEYVCVQLFNVSHVKY